MSVQGIVIKNCWETNEVCPSNRASLLPCLGSPVALLPSPVYFGRPRVELGGYSSFHFTPGSIG